MVAALRKIGQPEQAVQAALARRELWPRSPQHLLTVAEELTLASSMLPEQSDSATTKEQAVTLALDTLRQAIAEGLALPAGFDTNESFAAIRGDRRLMDLVGK